MKKIFIDCGTHLFQGFEQFVSKYNIDKSWECHSFEANPITFEKSKLKYDLLSKKFNPKVGGDKVRNSLLKLFHSNILNETELGLNNLNKKM